MVEVLDELGLTGWRHRSTGSVPSGPPRSPPRTATPNGSPPAARGQARRPRTTRERSGTFTGKTKLTGVGRPRLRAAAWRAAWGALQTNTVYANRYRHLTDRERNALKPTQAQAVIAATILRQLHAVITTERAWDPDIAAGGLTGPSEVTMAA